MSQSIESDGYARFCILNKPRVKCAHDRLTNVSGKRRDYGTTVEAGTTVTTLMSLRSVCDDSHDFICWKVVVG